MTTTTAHAETQAGVRPVLLGCGTPTLLLRIETPIPVTVTQTSPDPFDPDGYTVHRVEHTPTAALEPRTLGVRCTCFGWSTPRPQLSRPPHPRRAVDRHLTRKEQPRPSPSPSPATPPPTPRSVSAGVPAGSPWCARPRSRLPGRRISEASSSK